MPLGKQARLLLRVRVAEWKGPGQTSTQEIPLNNKVEARKITVPSKKNYFLNNESNMRHLQSFQFSWLCCIAVFPPFFEDCSHRTKAFSRIFGLAELFEESEQVRQSWDGQRWAGNWVHCQKGAGGFPCLSCLPTLLCLSVLLCLSASHCKLWQLTCFSEVLNSVESAAFYWHRTLSVEACNQFQ